MATKTTKQVTFEAPEGFAEMAPKVQVNTVAAWVAANPTAKIAPIAIADGGLPTYLRRDVGKRADINRLMVAGVTMAKYLPNKPQVRRGVHRYSGRPIRRL